jgi:transposase
MVAFEAGGYCLWSKRLEQGCFARPSSGACKLSLNRTALLALLDGIDIVIKRQRKRYKKRHH